MYQFPFVPDGPPTDGQVPTFDGITKRWKSRTPAFSSSAPTWPEFFVASLYTGSVENGGIFTPFKTLQPALDAAAAYVLANPGSKPVLKLGSGSYGAINITCDVKLSAVSPKTRGAFQNNVPGQSDVLVGDVTIGSGFGVALDGISQVVGGITFADDGALLLSNGCGLGNITSTTPGTGISLHASDSSFGSADSLDTDAQLNNVVCLAGLTCIGTVGTPQIYLVDCSMMAGAVTFSGNAGNVNVDGVTNWFLKNTPVAIVNGTKTILEDDTP